MDRQHEKLLEILKGRIETLDALHQELRRGLSPAKHAEKEMLSAFVSHVEEDGMTYGEAVGYMETYIYDGRWPRKVIEKTFDTIGSLYLSAL